MGLTWLAELKTERDELRRNFHASVFDVKQKSTFRSLLFEKKLSAMQRIQEEREAQLVEVLSIILCKSFKVLLTTFQIHAL